MAESARVVVGALHGPRRDHAHEAWRGEASISGESRGRARRLSQGVIKQMQHVYGCQHLAAGVWAPTSCNLGSVSNLCADGSSPDPREPARLYPPGTGECAVAHCGSHRLIESDRHFLPQNFTAAWQQEWPLEPFFAPIFKGAAASVGELWTARTPKGPPAGWRYLPEQV